MNESKAMDEEYAYPGQKILVPQSLQETLWRLEEARLASLKCSDSEVDEALCWVLGRQGLKGAYRGLFAPTEADFSQGARFLTGERIRTGAGTAHVLGEEALRALCIWGLQDREETQRALENYHNIVEHSRSTGRYCCYTCTIALWRGVNAARPAGWEEVLEKGLTRLKQARTPEGRWRGYPFYYTLLTLAEIDSPAALQEQSYAAKVVESLLRRNRGDDRVSRFRRLALKWAVVKSQGG
jgi:hypothetical protein